MLTIEDLRRVAEERRTENMALSLAYSKTLARLIPANFVLVVGAALLALVAGGGFLIDNQILSPTTAGVLSLMSGALTIVHSKLGCESYQAECKKLASIHRGIAVDYGNTLIVEDLQELRKRLISLDEQVAATIKSAGSLPFESAHQRAKAATN